MSNLHIPPQEWQPSERVQCPNCEGSGGGPGDRFNPRGACGYCEGDGAVSPADAARIRETIAWLAERNREGVE